MILFEHSSNLLRLWVLRVCQQSEKHLDKIINVDEFVKRIFTVIHTNDPIARALALRTLGAVAGVIPEKQQVHHAIRRSLDSHDAVEVEAAIQASVQFAAQSKLINTRVVICLRSSWNDFLSERLQLVCARKWLPWLSRYRHLSAWSCS